MACAQLPAVRNMWDISVPQMAFEYQPLLHALLAIAALHRATLLPNETRRLQHICQMHIVHSIQHHRERITEMSRADKGLVADEPVCVNAMLISFYALALRRETFPEPYEPPTQWLYMARGVRAVVRTIYHQAMQSSGSRIRPIMLESPHIPVASRNKLICSDTRASPPPPFGFLLHCHCDEEQADEKLRKAYTVSVVYLNSLYAAVKNRAPDYEVRKRFTGFPAIVPKRFLALVAEKRPRALVILAHFFAFGKLVEDIWWLRGIPEREVYGVYSILPPQWRWAMNWPLLLASFPPGTMADDIDIPLPTAELT